MQQQQANTSDCVQYVTVQVTTSDRSLCTLYWIVYVLFCETCTSSHNVRNDLVFGNNKEH